ncbi:MAG: DMT family transporter [Dehalococcoidia bacterium]|jgi:drug/metabolite transporter (DMT)-like permease
MRARLYIMLGALLFSTGGVAIKASTLTGWQLSCFRSLTAAVALLVFLPVARRGWSWRSFVVAIPYAATFTLFTLANKYTTAANAIFLQDTAPFYILLFGPLLLGERIRQRDLSFMAALLVGLGLIFASTHEATVHASDPKLGDLLALVSGLTWALTVLGLRWIAVRAEHHDDEPAAAVVAGCLVASLFAVLFAFPVENASAGNWFIIAYLGIFQIALAYVFITDGIRHVRALEVSLLLLVEPVFSPVWVWLLLAESPAALAVVGGAIVISAIAVHAVRSGISAKAPLERPG